MLSTFIQDHGGDDAFATALGAKVGTVRVWKSRGWLPRAVWPEVVTAFPKVTLNDLKEIERVERKNKEAAFRQAAA